METGAGNSIKSIYRHVFLGSFDQGVIFIFLSFLVWNKTESMLTVALAFLIPSVVNTIIDYFFSSLSDKGNRVALIIMGNIGSAIFLSCYGLFESIQMMYFFIFLKSLFSKIYQTSLTPYFRETIPEDEYKSFIAKMNMYSTIGASIGGFALIYLYILTQSIPLVFIVSGFIELSSTLFLRNLSNEKQRLRKEVENQIDISKLKKFTLIYAIEAFGIALVINRFVIFLNDTQHLDIQNVGLVFFIVYGISNLLAAKSYHLFKFLPIKKMLIFKFAFQALTLIVMMNVKNLNYTIGMWFLFVFVSNVAAIYSDDHINKTLFTDIGKTLSKFRISIAISGIAGQVLIGTAWDNWGIGISFYFSGFILFILAVIISFLNLQTEKLS